jgi:DNA-binding XRE family transcriptional regulator
MVRLLNCLQNHRNCTTGDAYQRHSDTLPPEAAEAHQRVPAPAAPEPQFPAKLRHLRTQRGLSKSALARELGLAAHTFIGLLETGRKEPSAAFTVRLADFFGVTTDYLLWDAIPLEDDG